jgi:hypothetical protein
MKKLKLPLTFIIILITSFTAVLQGQKKFPDLSEASWHKADFIGLLDGVEAYDLYYHKDFKILDLDNQNNSVIIDVIFVYTPYGLKHHDDLDIPANILATEYLIGVDINHDRCFVYGYTKYFKNGDGGYSHQNESFGLIYPDPGTVEAYYVSLAKKLVKEKKN